MSELLLEIRSEEIPARMQHEGARELAEQLLKMFEQFGLRWTYEREYSKEEILNAPVDEIPFRDDSIFWASSPTRLTFWVRTLDSRQPERETERRGPREDAPAAAVEGFKKSLLGFDATIEVREDRKGRVLFARIKESGRPTAELLGEKLPEILTKFPWPKSMRWGSGATRWVRPLRSILCIFDGKIVPFEYAGIPSGNVTCGHRFLAPEEFEVPTIDEYRTRISAGKIILDDRERKNLIKSSAQDIARLHGLTLPNDEALLDEVKGLVEWPVPLAAMIDEQFMDVPGEVLVSTMRANQKYLTLRDAEGRLARRFVVVANNEADDGGATIIAGNERVLRARLWDARFFWEQDKKVSLESRLPKLASMVFHEKLGTQGQRVERLVELAKKLAPLVGADETLAMRAARLAKADLVSGMVGEFPELQGIMGSHYARIQGELPEVAAAIAEHYSPKGPEDRCPTAPVSVALALADRLDALAGFFAAGIRPTGSKDPFALRRAALGIIRLVLENRLRLDLAAFLDAEALAFVTERLKVHLRGEGVRHDIVAAAFGGTVDGDLVRVSARIAALRPLLESDTGTDLVAGYRRASNILAIEEKKDGKRYDSAPDPALAHEAQERALVQALSLADDAITTQLAQERFTDAMGTLASLRGPIDAFFEHVLVNAPEPALRVNRLLMLNRVRTALGGVADFGLIEDPGRATA